MWPLIPHGQSDTASLDNALEFADRGRLSHRPCHDDADPRGVVGQQADGAAPPRLLRISCGVIEPWDGPASIAFTDGRQIGATLDRNGLRARALHRHRRRRLHPRLGIGRAADPGREDRAQMAPAARQDAADRPRGRPHHRGTRRSSAPSPTPSPMTSGCARPSSSSKTSISRKSRRSRRTTCRRCSIASRPSATRRRTSSSSWSRWRSSATIRSARWAPIRRSPCSSRKPKLLYNYFKQNFAQVTQPADRSDPRRAGDEPGVDDRAAPEPPTAARPACTKGWKWPSRC